MNEDKEPCVLASRLTCLVREILVFEERNKKRGKELIRITNKGLVERLQRKLDRMPEPKEGKRGLQVSEPLLSHWKKGLCFPQDHHLLALRQVLEELFWEPPSSVEVLVRSLASSKISEPEWTQLLQTCNPANRLRVIQDKDTGKPRLAREISVMLTGRYGALPPGMGLEAATVVRERVSLCQEVVRKIGIELCESDVQKLKGFLYQVADEDLRRMRDEGPCEPWERLGRGSNGQEKQS